MTTWRSFFPSSRFSSPNGNARESTCANVSSAQNGATTQFESQRHCIPGYIYIPRSRYRRDVGVVQCLEVGETLIDLKLRSRRRLHADLNLNACVKNASDRFQSVFRYACPEPVLLNHRVLGQERSVSRPPPDLVQGERARAERACGQDKTRQDKTRQDKTKHAPMIRPVDSRLYLSRACLGKGSFFIRTRRLRKTRRRRWWWWWWWWWWCALLAAPLAPSALVMRRALLQVQPITRSPERAAALAKDTTATLYC